eukprot:COSAG01_NODE_3715_length_5769_cov_2.903175_9_plen_210_part_00
MIIMIRRSSSLKHVGKSQPIQSSDRHSYDCNALRRQVAGAGAVHAAPTQKVLHLRLQRILLVVVDLGLAQLLHQIPLVRIVVDGVDASTRLQRTHTGQTRMPADDSWAPTDRGWGGQDGRACASSTSCKPARLSASTVASRSSRRCRRGRYELEWVTTLRHPPHREIVNLVMMSTRRCARTRASCVRWAQAAPCGSQAVRHARAGVHTR